MDVRKSFDHPNSAGQPASVSGMMIGMQRISVVQITFLFGVLLAGVGLFTMSQPSQFEVAERATDEWSFQARGEVIDVIEDESFTYDAPAAEFDGTVDFGGEDHSGRGNDLLTSDVVPDALPTVPTVTPAECATLPVIGRLTVPQLDLDTPIWDDTSASLNCGPSRQATNGWLDGETPTYIAGHRTTYGRPFFDIQELVPGDQFTIETDIDGITETITYEIRVSGTQEGHGLVRPGNAPPDSQLGPDTLLLYGCHPRGSADWRIYVTAEPVERLIST